MERRDLLRLSGAALAAAPLMAAGSARAAGHDHKKHDDHKKHEPHTYEYQAWIDAASACVVAGDICASHCIRRFGDTSLQQCLAMVSQMVGICRAVGPVAAAESEHVKALAKLCHDVCTDCREACLEHADHHPECKACAEACKKTIEITQKIVG